MCGPVNGNWHDSFLPSTSGLLDKLQHFMPDLSGTVVFSLYGDPSYPHPIYIFGGYKNPLNGSAHALWNTTMSKVCEEVEWELAKILSQWSLDFRAGMKIFESCVAQYYIVGAFPLSYGNQTTVYFNCE
jgi:hypothetical protein